MKFEIVGRRYNVSDAVEQRIIAKIGKLSKFFGDEADAKVVLSKRKDTNIMETTILHKGIIYRAEEEAQDMYSAIDKVSELLERQIRKNKTRLEKNFRKSAFVPDFVNDALYEVEEESEFNVVKTKQISVKPMELEEAILQMNLLNHLFFVYKDSKTNDINIVYKRKDGAYGVIETK